MITELKSGIATVEDQVTGEMLKACDDGTTDKVTELSVKYGTRKYFHNNGKMTYSKYQITVT